MKFQVRGQNIEVTDAIQNYIEQKFQKISRHFSRPDEVLVRVLLKVYPDHVQRVEATVYAMHYILRMDQKQESLYAAIDLTVDKLERQIRKNKTRMNKHINKKHNEDNLKVVAIHDDEPEQIIVNKNDIVRVKHVELQPMDIEEAILQMDLLGHDFYLYRDQEVNKVCLLYRRKDGKYAIIEPQ